MSTALEAQHSSVTDNSDEDEYQDYENELLAQILQAQDHDCNQDSQHPNQDVTTLKPLKQICLDEERKREVYPDEDAANVDFAEGRHNVRASRGHRGDLYFKSRPCIYSGPFSKIPFEIYQNIFKFLSPVDLVNCSLVCKFMRVAASDESLWRRLYLMRWGLPSPDQENLQPCSWKKLYIEHDSADMIEFVRDSPVEFQEYFIQMQAAKRNEPPVPSKFNEDLMISDITVADQISQWKQSRGLPDVFTGDHVCSGRSCTYSQVGDVFLCEKTGYVHVCDHNCQETVYDTANQLLVCIISGRCSEQWICSAEDEVDPGHRHGDNAASDEAEPLTRAGELARAYLLGYNCNDEKELEVAVREVLYPGSNRI